MVDTNEISLEQVLQKIQYYKQEKRLQGFLLHKARTEFKKMKTAVRKLQLSVNPSNAEREFLKVKDFRIYPL